MKWHRFYHVEPPFRPQRRGIDPDRAQQWRVVIRQAWALQRRYYRENGWFQPTTPRDPPPGDFQQAYFDRVESDEELQEFRRDHVDD